MQQQVHRLQQNLVLFQCAPVVASASPINRHRTSPLLLLMLQPHAVRATVEVSGRTISPKHQPTTRGENFSLATSTVARERVLRLFVADTIDRPLEVLQCATERSCAFSPKSTGQQLASRKG